MHEHDLTVIKRILENLTSLSLNFDVYGNGDNKFDYNFKLLQTLCPNLTKLKLIRCSPSNRLVGYNTRWSKLENLSIDTRDVYGCGSLNSSIIRKILLQNPQIKTLKLPIDDGDRQAVAALLQNIQKLTIYRDNCQPLISAEDLVGPLITLKNLTRLTLTKVTNNELGGVLNCMKQFRSLRELKVFVIDKFSIYLNEGNVDEDIARSTQIQQSVIALAQNLAHLKRICLSRIDVIGSTVLEFIRFASNVEEIHIHRCHFIFTQKFILESVLEVLKVARSQNAIKPLKLFIDENESIDLEAIRKPNIKTYLCVSGNCHHNHH